MTVPASGPTFVQIPGNGSATVYPFPMKCFAATDVVVGFIIGGVYTLQSSGFTIQNIDLNTGGSVVFTTPPPFGTLVDIRTSTPVTQPTEFANLGAYLPESTTEAMDRLTRALQDVARLAVQFSVHAPDTESTIWPALPNAAARANTVLGFDANGLPIPSVVTGTVLTQAIFNSFLAPVFNTFLASGLSSIPYFAITSAEVAAGVTPHNYGYPPGAPERYYVGTFQYAADTTGTNGTNFSSAIATALSCVGQPCILGAHNYLFSNIAVPPGQAIIGLSQRLSNLIAAAGSAGIAIQDSGGAQGVVLRGFAAYLNGPSGNNNTFYTGGLRLGYNGVQFGTNGYLDDIWIRDLPAGFPGIDINGNIWYAGYLCAQSTGGVRFIGSGAHVTHLEPVFSLGFPSTRTGTNVCVELSSDGFIGYMENEAWANILPALQIDAPFFIGHAIFSFNNSTQWTGDHVIEVTANATSWQIGNLVAFAGGPVPSITGGWIVNLAGLVYFGGTGVHTAEGLQTANLSVLQNTAFQGSLSIGNSLSIAGNFGMGGQVPLAPVPGFGTPTNPNLIANFPGASATLVQCSAMIAQIIQLLKTFGFFAA